MISQLNLFRYVDGSTLVHRADARSKVLGLTVLIFGFSFTPGWTAIAIVWGLGLSLFLIARLPLGVLPRPPRLLLYVMGLALVVGIASGGDPIVDVAGYDAGLGGLILQLRFFAVTLGLLLLTLLIGWTTPAADLPRAASWMLHPLRLLRLPIDELVAGLTVAVRALPLVADEFSTVVTLWRSRPRTTTIGGFRGKMIEGVDIGSTVTTAAVRRATELGEAMDNRGLLLVRYRHPRWGIADLFMAVLLLGASAAITMSPV